MKRIAIATSTRAEYGLLTPLIKRVIEEEDLKLDLIVTGTHLSKKHGYTIDDIRKDGYEISHEIPILDEDNSAYGISVTMSNALKGLAKCFRDDRPDMVVILGDRTEMLAVALAALNELIPIAHIHGGELTQGAVDDCIRHAITKMSYLHFTSTEMYRQRVIQLGESPDRVYNVGALGVENVLSQKLLGEDKIRADIGIPNMMKYSIVTFHPVTMESDSAKEQVEHLCEAMCEREDIYFVITGSNADAGGDLVNQRMREFASKHSNADFVHSLGMKRYLSAVKYASFVLGNSSSGIIEAPALGTLVVNIGDRQKGRIHGADVIDCKPEKTDIASAMNKAMAMEIPEASKTYGNGNTSAKIVEIIKEQLKLGIELKKSFYDINQK